MTLTRSRVRAPGGRQCPRVGGTGAGGIASARSRPDHAPPFRRSRPQPRRRLAPRLLPARLAARLPHRPRAVAAAARGVGGDRSRRRLGSLWRRRLLHVVRPRQRDLRRRNPAAHRGGARARVRAALRSCSRCRCCCCSGFPVLQILRVVPGAAFDATPAWETHWAVFEAVMILWAFALSARSVALALAPAAQALVARAGRRTRADRADVVRVGDRAE